MDHYWAVLFVRSHTSCKFPDRARLWDYVAGIVVSVPQIGRGRGTDVTVSRYGEAVVVLG